MIKTPKFIILLQSHYYLFVSRSFGQAEKELTPPEYIKHISIIPTNIVPKLMHQPTLKDRSAERSIFL